ncbi:hypothetical protein PoB_002444700 [Plakobranchus ocellatus]|uniref:Uncharacterized protein n=1 Tax=Plakobranchus ocellatus TaxID=259542 RepID=A0AAV3ZTR4_9GAST|nr:hypothetical protein PoB_002444700 [Plakobranchus ocellatus]
MKGEGLEQLTSNSKIEEKERRRKNSNTVLDADTLWMMTKANNRQNLCPKKAETFGGKMITSVTELQNFWVFPLTTDQSVQNLSRSRTDLNIAIASKLRNL